MKKNRSYLIILLLLPTIFLLLTAHPPPVEAHQVGDPLITGTLHDTQNQPVSGATVSLSTPGVDSPISEAVTQPDGRYALSIPEELPEELQMHFERKHFQSESLELSAEEMRDLTQGRSVVIPDMTMERRVSIAFWIATIIFIVVLVLIASGILHNTLAALVGASLLFLISYLGPSLHEDLFIFNFESSLGYID